MKPMRTILFLTLALAGGLPAFGQTNGVPGPTDYTAFSRFIADRNIFDPSRQPHYTSSHSRPVVHPHTHSTSAPAFTLVGTLSYAKGWFAFFNGNNSDLKKALAVHGEIAGYTVTAVTATGVTLENAGKKQTVVLKVGDLMRQENGDWQTAGPGDLPAGTSSPESAGSPTADHASSPPPSSAEANDVLKQLMLKREKELQ